MPDLPGRLSGKCDGIERHPNPCTCDCEGCKYHCSAHVEGRTRSPGSHLTTLAEKPDMRTTCYDHEGVLALLAHAEREGWRTVSIRRLQRVALGYADARAPESAPGRPG